MECESLVHMSHMTSLQSVGSVLLLDAIPGSNLSPKQISREAAADGERILRKARTRRLSDVTIICNLVTDLSS